MDARGLEWPYRVCLYGNNYFISCRETHGSGYDGGIRPEAVVSYVSGMPTVAIRESDEARMRMLIAKKPTASHVADLAGGDTV
jgi:hypothetical protein